MDEVADEVTAAERALVDGIESELLAALNDEYERLLAKGHTPAEADAFIDPQGRWDAVPRADAAGFEHVPGSQDAKGARSCSPDPSISSARISPPFIALDHIVENLMQVDRQLAALQAARIDLLASAGAWASDAAETGIVYGTSRGEKLEYAHRTVVAEIAAAVHESERTTSRKLSQAHGIAAVPVARAALGAGRISQTHAAIIAETCQAVPREARTDLAAALLPIAETRTPGILARKARTLRERIHSDPIDERHRTARHERHVRFEPADDGMAWLHQYGPAAQLLREYVTLSAMATRMQGPDEHRTVAQLRSDLLGDLILTGTTADKLHRIHPGQEHAGKASKRARRSARPRVTVTVPMLTLLGIGDEPAVLDGYGPIDTETARALTAEAPSLARLLTHPVTGAMLALDRSTYRVPADLRRFIQTRDGTCRSPGCTRPASSLDLDHTVAWEHGGPTDSGNLAALCRRDHRKKHKLGWRLSQDSAGTLTWASPTGRTYATEAERPLQRPLTSTGDDPPPF